MRRQYGRLAERGRLEPEIVKAPDSDPGFPVMTCGQLLMNAGVSVDPTRMEITPTHSSAHRSNRWPRGMLEMRWPTVPFVIMFFRLMLLAEITMRLSSHGTHRKASPSFPSPPFCGGQGGGEGADRPQANPHPVPPPFRGGGGGNQRHRIWGQQYLSQRLLA